MAGRLDHTIRFASPTNKQTFAEGNGKNIYVKKFVKSLRYTDEFLLSTNDYYFKVVSDINLQGIKPATLVTLDKICQSCFFPVSL